MFTSKGVKADPSKISSMTEMKNPTDKSGVRQLLGTANYLAKFLPKLSDAKMGMPKSAVRRAKKVVRVAEATKRDPYLILLDNRNTPQEGLDTSPA